MNAREELNFGGPNFDIEDYAFVNIAAEYEINPHFSIFGRIDNLTNEQYSEVFGFPRAGPRRLRRIEGAVLSAIRPLRRLGHMPYLEPATCHSERSRLSSRIVKRRLNKSLLFRTNTLNMSLKLSDKKLAVLGAGKLGGILLRAYLKQGLFVVQARHRHGKACGERQPRLQKS